MAEIDYEKYIIREPFQGGIFTQRLLFDSKNYFPNLNFGLRAFSIQLPFEMEKPHSHDFDQLFCFLGVPEDMAIFPGEAELCLGEESTKIIIDSTTVAYVPAGMVHCPIRWTRVDKPMFFLNITFSPSYVRVGHKTTFYDELANDAKKVTLEEARRILGAAVPQPTYLPEGCKIQEIYSQDDMIKLLIFDKKIEKKQAFGHDFMKLLISEEDIKKRGLNINDFLFAAPKPYSFESKIVIDIKWFPEGKAGGLKLHGEQVNINKGEGLWIDQERYFKICWLLPPQSTPKQPGQYEIELRASKLMTRDELLKITQSILA